MTTQSEQTDERERANTQSADLVVLVSGVFHAAYDELLPVYEQETGLAVESYLSPSMGKSPDSVSSRLERGQPADVLIMAEPGLDHVFSEGLALGNTKVSLARAPVGIAVKQGSAKPDISTEDKLKDALLTAKSVAYSISASGQWVSGQLFDTLGIREPMKDRAHQVPGTTPVAQTIADGTYEIGFQSLSELGAVEGVTLVGALPSPVEHSTSVAGAVAAHSRRPDEAAALLRFLSRSDFAPILARHGLVAPTQ